ncbi:MAG TPA: EAL domain-containing protein [Steroidobacteraceae bacterium]|jgi:diguanylate cyclase (GGDEF)-like protein|nr:EAL domain-containing protein [Steroidobacteraceae bacterium]
MTKDGRSGTERAAAWGSFEPYVQLIRALLPRASSVAVFDAAGEMRWTSETTIGPDLVQLIEEILPNARADRSGAGELRVLGGTTPVYACWLRNDNGDLLAILAIVCRGNGSIDSTGRGFSLAHAFLRPALECMRRDLLARALIDDLTGTVTALDRDLELLLSDATRAPGSGSEEDELKGIVQQALEHLRCATAALIVPDKGIVLLRSTGEHAAANQLIARTHRQLLKMGQMRREPVVINKLNGPVDGATLPYRILACPIAQHGGKGAGILAMFRELGAPEFSTRDARLGGILARKANSVIESNYDAMSGLYTRPAFENRVRAVVGAAKKNAPWSALYIDTDQLHVINDHFGMHIGDGVIGQLGELIRRRLPPGAFGARISGDRFAVLLPTALEDAAQFAESLREGVEQLGTMHGEARMHVSISIGVAALDTESGELMHSLAAAETACKAAKDRGRNRVETYHSSDLSMVRRFTDINIAARLRDAIAENRFRLYAQLITPMNAAANAHPYYELLLRMIDEDGQTLGPDRFLSAANRYQLMPTIDRSVIDQAIASLKPYAELLSGHAVGFAINFSGQSLNDDHFGDFLLERITASGLDPSVFTFELTETATVANIARAQALMERLRGLGCGVALDDFGTGLSSLSYLRQLPVTTLKIDGSFVRDILKDARSDSMVNAIAQLARSMSIATVAEYVETEEIRQRIAAIGVDYGQGFAIGHPIPFSEVLAELPLLASAAAPVTCSDDSLPTLRTANMR